MEKRKLAWVAGLALLSFLVSWHVFAQEVQKVTITGIDNKFEPTEIRLKPGKTEITLVNKGELRHNLRMKVGDKELRSEQAPAGQSVKMEVDLPPGEYDMYCTSSDGGGNHKEKGMIGKIIVK